tara:strand:- start:241 stop:534 length:294 start_codon:yes stop_codon:yes gene_type:complete
MKALIFNNKVVDVAESEFEVADSLEWVVCTDDCMHGWLVVDGIITEPTVVELTWSEKRKAKYDLLNQNEMRFDDLTNSTTTWVDAINAIKTKYPKPS